MKTLYEPLLELNEYQRIVDKLQKKSDTIQINGCIDSQQLHMINGLGNGFKNKVIVTFSDQRAKEICDEYRFYDREVVYYPNKDYIFYSADVRGNLIVKERMHAIRKILEDKNITVVTSIDGLMDKLLPIDTLKDSILHFATGDTIDLEKCREVLVMLGYERTSQVDAPGEFAIRGSIIDIFPLTEELPFRIDLWDDEIDSIKSFDKDSQRSIENLEEITVYPATEYVLNEVQIASGLERIKKELDKHVNSLRKKMLTEEAHRISSTTKEFVEMLSISQAGALIDSYVNYFCEKSVSFIDYFDISDTIFFVDEPNRIAERCDAVMMEFRESMVHRLEKGYLLPNQADLLFDAKTIFGYINVRKSVLFTTLDQKINNFDVAEKFFIEAKNVNPYNNSVEMLVKDLQKYKKMGYKMLILSASKTRAERLADDLFKEYDLSSFYSEDKDRVIKAGEIMVSTGNIHKGFEYPMIKFVVIAETDIFAAEKKKKRKKTNYSGSSIQSFSELNIGDYVVHENHGLGIYKGIEKIEVDKVAKDYIKIEYASSGNLYILATQLDMIQKYASSDAKKPKLNKLGTQEWNKTKTRVKGAVKDIAKDLVALYAKRQAKSGFACGSDTVWQREFEEVFPYEETGDQLKAIEDTKKDMESHKIMDRLICGDVGFGKTEIAIRAAFKAVQEGKQVVFLVPTTILAQQHYNTFSQRMKDYPVTVEMMSRFRTASEQKNTIANVKKGFVDILIGTHRVLSEDIKYKELGLLIIDEEQRFGVTHKEKLKKLKENVDVLTLSATPIPRTLHMSLIGIRDMSVLEEPPVDRIPIQTYVMEYNDEMIREAINREMSRGGQVYYVYNRVNNIEEIAGQIAKLVPDANVAFAHGQMSERKLEKIMYDFINGDIDVLVSTTIIETGLDISNVNTMIIHDADKLGLSQLYQLRGRIGRSNRTAYAFLMYKRDKMLKEVAEKRLQAIREFTELGAGFKIAMRDLEIRGAGNILGAEQHGHMEAVGYDLYCKMLNEAVIMMKGEKIIEDDFETTVDIDVDAFIPSTYIKNEIQKLNIYKKIAGIENKSEYEDMQDELMDRFGEMPKNVLNLLGIALIKALAHSTYITDIKANNREIRLDIYRNAPVNIANLQSLVDRHRNKLKFTAESSPYLTYKIDKVVKDIDDYIDIITCLLNDIEELIIERDNRNDIKKDI